MSKQKYKAIFSGVVTTEGDRREVESLRGMISEGERQAPW